MNMSILLPIFITAFFSGLVACFCIKQKYYEEKDIRDINIECLTERIISDHVDGKYGNIICVHTSDGFCTKEQETFYDTIGEFIYGEMPRPQRDYMTPYGSDGDYEKDQINQLEIISKEMKLEREEKKMGYRSRLFARLY